MSTLTESSWRVWINQRRGLLGGLLAALLFGVALIACWHLLSNLDAQSLRSALFEVPNQALIGAVLATVLGFICLLGYEWSAAHYAQVQLPAKAIGYGGFCAFAVGNALGMSLLTGGGVRYRLYSPYNLGAADIARMTLFASLSLGCALPLLAALASLINLPSAARALHSTPLLIGSIASLVVAGYVFVSLWLWRKRELPAPSLWRMVVQIKGKHLELPSPKLAGLQLLITLLDVCAAATVLYLLLPDAPSFSGFLLIYLIALAAGVLSHVPGGVGVFEAVLLAAFADRFGAAPLAAALLLYRLIYVLVPLLLACVLMLWHETRRFLPGPATLRLASGMAAPILSLMVFIAGALLLITGAMPPFDERLHRVSFLLPAQLVETSHLGASLIGMLCLLLAQGLRRRLSAAWALTLLLLICAAILCLFKGLALTQPLGLMALAVLLALFRPAFYRPSRLFELPFSPGYGLATFGVLASSLWLLLFAYQDVPYNHQLWWQFELDDEAPRGLRALLASTLVFAGIGLTWLLRSAPPASPAPDEAALEQARTVLLASTQPEGGLALAADKALLFTQDQQAFLMYGCKGRSLVALFDPIGEPERRAELIWQFRDLCDLHHMRPVFYQVRAENLPLYMDIGLTAIKLGEEALVDLHEFDLSANGKAMKGLRYSLSRGQRDGLEVSFYAPGQAPLEELQGISDAWLAGKKGREKGFSLGRFSADYLKHFGIVMVRHQGVPVAFANLLETEQKHTASLDLMRLAPEAPQLTMEFMLVSVIKHFQDLGYQQFSLGMVPLSGLTPRAGAPLPQRLGALLFSRGESFYNFQGLRRFKEKFQPNWQPRYLAVPAGIEPYLALADTTALISGGLSGLVQR